MDTLRRSAAAGAFGRLKRRGLIAGAAGLVAAALAKLAGPYQVQAANGDTLRIGNTGAGQVGQQSATNNTQLTCSDTKTFELFNTSAAANSAAMVATAPNVAGGRAYLGEATANSGAYAFLGQASGTAIRGETGSGIGVQGVASVGFAPSVVGGFGVRGHSGAASSTSVVGSGVWGDSATGFGVVGSSGQLAGVFGATTGNNPGVQGLGAGSGPGV